MGPLKPVVPLAALFVVAALAGCLGSGNEDLEEPTVPAGPAVVPAQAAEPFTHDPLPSDGPGHNHKDPGQHDVAVNMELVNYVRPEASTDVHYWNAAIPLGLNIRFGELDVKGDWLAQCSRDTEGAYLWDISNRSAPVVASRLEGAGNCPDIKLTDDANYAVMGGNKLYDLRDKTNASLVLESDTPSCHMCSLITIDGAEYVVLSAQGEGYSAGGRNVRTAAGFSIVKMTRDPPAMEVVGTWMKNLATESLPTLAEQDIANTVHDQYVYHDKVLGKPVVVTAMWDYGVYFVDISDPAAPKDLGKWGAYRGESGNIHTTAVDFRNVSGEERRILVAATETGFVIGGVAAAEPGYVYIFDASDLGNIELLGKWANPGRRSTGVSTEFFPTGEYSAHNVQFTMGRVYMGHYHAGVWVIDVDAFLATDPAPKGDVRAPLPDAVPNLGMMLTRDPEQTMSGQVWDVVVKDGYIYASDYTLGLFVMHFLGDPLNDPAYSSTA